MMQIIRKMAIALTGCLVLASCEPATQVDPAAEADTIRALGAQWQAAVDAKDIDAAVSFFASDAREMVAGGPSVVGKEAIREWFASWILDPAVSNTFAPELIEVAASGDLAYEWGTSS